MTSLRHNPDSEQARPSTPDDAYLDAAREAILAVGWSRTTLTDIARRAGVSRMTLYRRWPDTQTLLADLMTREWGHVVESASAQSASAQSASAQSASVESARADRVGAPEGGNVLDRIAGGVIATVQSLRDNALLRRIVDVDPEVLLPYLLDRRGRSQEMVAETLAGLIAAGQGEGSVRAGDPVVLARSLVLACHGFTLSAHTMSETASRAADVSHLDVELETMVRRYLQP